LVSMQSALPSFAFSSSWMVGIGVVSLMQCSLIMLITASAFTLTEFGACVCRYILL
jgi:hypothetical protein